MNILCIDPGTTESGAVYLDGTAVVWSDPAIENSRMIETLELTRADMVLIEMVSCYGMPVGKETFETCVWIGRFIEAFNGQSEYVFRRDVKLTLCNSMRAKDANVRQAILDRYPATGGGKTPQVGTKSQPGPLYGMRSHAWSALALGLTWIEKQKAAEGVKMSVSA
jgi:hypothetical protein